MNPNRSKNNVVLIVDDEPLTQDLLSDIIQETGCHIVRGANISEAQQTIKKHPDLAVVLCDHVLPDGKGLDFLRKIKTTHPQIIRILVTGFPDTQIALAAINQGEIFRFITKPCLVEEVKIAIHEAFDRIHLLRENQRLQAALVAGNEQLQKTNVALQKALSSSVTLCLDILDRFDHILASHSLRVAQWSVNMGKNLGLSNEQLNTLEIAAQMHDIGLISASRTFHPLLHQQQSGWDALPPVQQVALHSHPKTGAELVKFLDDKGVPEVIQTHHEWFNGNGYPSQIQREQIPLLASILSIPDAYDEIRLAGGDGAGFIQDNLGTRFDPEFGRLFLRLVSDRSNYSELEREVLISELQPGMKVSCNVFSALGVLLVPKDQTLSSKLIQYIHQHNESDPLTQRIFIAA